MMAQDENLEITGGFGVERAKGELIQREESGAGWNFVPAGLVGTKVLCYTVLGKMGYWRILSPAPQEEIHGSRPKQNSQFLHYRPH